MTMIAAVPRPGAALATTALTACTGKAAPGHASSAAPAEKALDKGQASKAVRHAEAAVLASPRDAATRTLLANAYLEDGRFASAATTFAEAGELGDTAPRTVISFTLAQIAVGDQRGALAERGRQLGELRASADFQVRQRGERADRIVQHAQPAGDRKARDPALLDRHAAPVGRVLLGRPAALVAGLGRGADVAQRRRVGGGGA